MSYLILKQNIRPTLNNKIFSLISDLIESDLNISFRNKYSFWPSLKQNAKYFALADTINNFSKLIQDWDSYNADVISKIAIKLSLKILHYLNTEDYIFDVFEINVFPMRDGGIQYEFDRKNLSAELEISPSGEMLFILYDIQGNILKTKKMSEDELFELSTLLEEIEYA